MFIKIKLKIFTFIRKNFWKDYDPNEDFSCGYCGKPLFRRILFCSQECSDLFYMKAEKEECIVCGGKGFLEIDSFLLGKKSYPCENCKEEGKEK